MDGKKNMIGAIVAMALVLLLYCVLAFMMPFPRGTVFWLSFAFTVVALLAQIWVLYASFARGEGARSRFFGIPLAKVGLTYLVAQLIAGFVCMAMGTLLPVWVTVVLLILILGAAAVGLIPEDGQGDEAVREETDPGPDN